MQKIFVPFTKDKRFWSTNIPMVFLNKAYEEQIDSKDDRFQYDTLSVCFHYAKDQKFQLFKQKLVYALGKVLNEYHGVNEDTLFWNKLLIVWMDYYTCGIQAKIEQLNYLKEKYPRESYHFCTYASHMWKQFDFLPIGDDWVLPILSERYHFFSSLWLAERYYDFQIEELPFDLCESNMGDKSEGTKSFRECVGDYKEKIFNMIFRVIPSSRMQVGIYNIQTARMTLLKWFLKSVGLIRPLRIQHNSHKIELDLDFRNSLNEKIMMQLSVTKEEEAIIDLLPRVLPRFYIEDFKNEYIAASHYLDTHPDLRIIFTGSGTVNNSLEKISMVLLQERGGKVLGQQHGGNYQISKVPLRLTHELFLNDMFYFWGRAALDLKCDGCVISYGPAYKLEQYSSLEKKRSNYILFAGTSVDVYGVVPTQVGILDEEREEYITRQMRFFSLLDDVVMSKMMLREFNDLGWHVGEKVKEAFPMIKLSSILESDFSELLVEASFIIVDHIGTVWIEALFCNKPMIMMLLDDTYSIADLEFIEKEKEFFDMLETVGIVFYAVEEAALQMNRIMQQGINEWWLDEKRQEVVKLVRERWAMEVDNIDDWWYQELMVQSQKAKEKV